MVLLGAEERSELYSDLPIGKVRLYYFLRRCRKVKKYLYREKCRVHFDFSVVKAKDVLFPYALSEG